MKATDFYLSHTSVKFNRADFFQSQQAWYAKMILWMYIAIRKFLRTCATPKNIKACAELANTAMYAAASADARMDSLAIIWKAIRRVF